MSASLPRPALVLDMRPAFLVARLGAPHEVLSWAIVGGGRRRADTVVWHGVRNAELPPGVDPVALLEARLREAELGGAVAMMTSRDLAAHHRRDAERDGVRATAVVTAGLSNGMCIGDPAGVEAFVGTINVLCRISAPLTELAMLEALSLVVEARTAAVLEADVPSFCSEARATGTGTDCVTIAAPVAAQGASAAPYAGKHTVIGEVIGRATLGAMREAVALWKRGIAR
jgi:adenosylcobinamide amidohydrolase